MIGIGTLDLADPADDGPLGDGPCWILVRHGRNVIGELKCDDLAEIDRDAGGLRAIALEHYPGEIRTAAAPVESTHADNESFSVIVCTRQRPELLEDCLTHLLALDPAPGEILVVDNAPEDDATERMARRFGVAHIVEPVPGLDRARNTGWRASTRDIVVYIDDDARADPALIAAYGHLFADAQVGAASGLVLPFELAERAQVEFERLGGMRKGFRRRFFDARSVGAQSFQLGVGTNMAFRRAALADVGGFDPELDVGTASRGGGDLDGLWRVLNAGHKVAYEPNAVVRHIHRRTIRGLVDQHRDYGTAYRAVLERTAQRFPEKRSIVKREIRRWHVHRHVRGPLGALRRRDWLLARLLLAEAMGSRAGVASVRTAQGTADR